jgi:hypothetical protein
MTAHNEEEIFEAGFIAGASGRIDMTKMDKKKSAKDTYQEYLRDREQSSQDTKTPKAA